MMNELRMYVERLFEGKVLTAENIELKEEIYGNLVARYEDLIAGGMEADEALRRTKESFTSVDDVLDGGLAEGPDVNPVEDSAEERDGQGAKASVDSEPAAASSGSPLCGGAAATNEQGGPTPIAEDGAASPHSQPSQAPERKRVWPIVLVSVLAGVLLLGIGFAGCSLMLGVRSLDRSDSKTTSSVEDTSDSTVEEGTNGSGSNGAGNGKGDQGAASASNREIFVDEAGQIWVDGEPGDELATEVVNAGYDVVSQYLDTDLSDAARVESLLRSLPMGGYAGDIDVTKGDDVLSLAYREVPETYDSDSVDAALVYDMTAVFCAMPLVNEIQVTVTESDDPLDEDYYVFLRDNMQGCYGVRLDDAMVNEDGWRQLKNDNLYRRHFIERMVDAAEREWR